MIIGFTGTREGMTPKQYSTVIRLLGEYKPDLVVHGDSVGADSDFHRICIKIQGSITNPGPPRIKLRPTTFQRAFNEGYSEVLPAKQPLERNHDIVDECDRLIACPSSHNEEIRSGTWATIRYARLHGVMVDIIYPDGSLH